MPRPRTRRVLHTAPPSDQRRVDALISGLSPFAWFRADTFTFSGSNVATLPDRCGTGALLSTGAAIGACVLETTLASRAALAFTGTQYFDSNRAASVWRFLHDGSGYDVFHVFTPKSLANLGPLMATRVAAGFGVGYTHYYQTNGNQAMVVGNGTANLFPPITAAGGATVDQGTYWEADYSSSQTPQAALFNKAVSVTTAAAVGSPAAGDSAGTLRLGAFVTGGFFLVARWADSIIFNRVLTPAQRTQVRTYIARRYGL